MNRLIPLITAKLLTACSGSLKKHFFDPAPDPYTVEPKGSAIANRVWRQAGSADPFATVPGQVKVHCHRCAVCIEPGARNHRDVDMHEGLK